MGTDGRRVRPKLSRTAPIRQMSAGAGSAGSTDSAPPSGTEGQPASARQDDILGYSVKLAYQVAEEQIRQGQRMAERLGNASYRAARGTGNGMAQLLERALGLYEQAGELWVEAAEMLARSPALLAKLYDAEKAGGAGAPADTAAPTPAAKIVVEVSCSRRTQVQLDLPSQAGAFTPAVRALHAAEPTVAPLSGVKFGQGADAVRILQIDIPDGQPSGTYAGAVVDDQTNEPRGTLCVRVFG